MTKQDVIDIIKEEIEFLSAVDDQHQAVIQIDDLRHRLENNMDLTPLHAVLLATVVELHGYRRGLNSKRVF